MDLANNAPGDAELDTVIHGDCVEALRGLSSKVVDLTILDPPYFKVVGEPWDHKWTRPSDFLEWFESVIEGVSRVSKNNSSLYLFGYWRMLYKQIPILEKYGFQFKQSITIDKGMRSVCGRRTKTYTIFPNTTEHVLYFVKDNYPQIKRFLKARQKTLKLKSKTINAGLGVKTNGGGMWSIYTGNNVCRQIPTKANWEKLQSILDFELPYEDIKFTFNIEMGLTDVWSDIDFYKEKRLHPTQKPIKLLSRIIRANSNPGDLVLDPFLGSGNTIRACVAMGRHYVGMEQSDKYIDHVLAATRRAPAETSGHEKDEA